MFNSVGMNKARKMYITPLAINAVRSKGSGWINPAPKKAYVAQMANRRGCAYQDGATTLAR
jgi:hypothetical protein